MLFITNRLLKEGHTPKNSNELPRIINFAEENTVQQEVFFCRRIGENDYREIGHFNFFNELKLSNYQQIFFYLHGFNNLPEKDIFRETEKLQNLFDQQQNNLVQVVPLIWPCDNDYNIFQDYFDDQKAADASDMAFMRLFEKFLNWRDSENEILNTSRPCTKRLNILAHSMGNRVLMGALKRSAQYYLSHGIPLIFRNIFMAAADILNESLEFGQDGQFISQAARNVVVYYAGDDLALRSSKVANIRNGIASRRLGHTGPEKMDKVANNIYALDCGDFNEQYDSPIGHEYFSTDNLGYPGLLFRHICKCLQTGRVPLKELKGNRQILNGELLALFDK
ncbi:MAG: alpha/beta hydrolase [Xenococcaceae cyanobacterium MO_207.B15]|nr:alpha/beta hydrolase [Xenococcaceae cyanobacterium MO_207.B15]